jgi:general secretion pathway protein J
MMRIASRGFTLVEVLVALFVMALLAAMAWQGIDGIARARVVGQERIEQSLRVQTVLMQWEQDLAALQDTNAAPPLTFDGATVRLVRRTEGGVQMVAWSLRGGHWMRWSGPVVTRAVQLQDSWMRSQQLMGNEPGQLDALRGIDGWQVYFYRNNSWSNAQSTGDVKEAPPVAAPPGAPTSPGQVLPTGVRIVLTFNGAPLQGSLTRDVMLSVQPQ